MSSYNHPLLLVTNHYYQSLSTTTQQCPLVYKIPTTIHLYPWSSYLQLLLITTHDISYDFLQILINTHHYLSPYITTCHYVTSSCPHLPLPPLMTTQSFTALNLLLITIYLMTNYPTASYYASHFSTTNHYLQLPTTTHNC